MEWLFYLLLLVCPLMMFFMMKGHCHGHGGHEHHHSQSSKDIDSKMANLEKENE